MFKSLMNKEMLLIFFLQLCFGIVGALLVQVAMTRDSLPAIATVNITSLVDSFLHETANQSLSGSEKKQRIIDFGNRLDHTISQLAAKRHLVLMPSEAVIAGSPDLTQEVANRIKKESNR